MNYTQAAAELIRAIALNVPPVAVSFAAEKPGAAESVSERVAAGCAFWEIAATRSIVTSASDHEMCSIGVYTHNLAEPSSELTTVLKVLGDMQYATDADVALVPVLNTRPKYVLYSPLSSTSLDPDVVLIFAQAQQSLIVAEAVQQVENGVPPAMGRPACAVIPQVVNTGRAALSLGCCGARAYLSVLTDDVALWALPGKTLSQYVDRIVSLAHANEILSKFHKLRMQDVAQGHKPTYQESLARLQA